MNRADFVITVLTVLCITLVGCSKESSGTTSSAGTPAEVDACTLLTAAEIESVTGVAPGAAEQANPGLNNCQWPSNGETVPIVYIGLSYKAADSWEEYRTYMIENEYGDPEENGERVDIEVFGYYMPDVAMIQVQSREGSLMTLRVRKGTKAQIMDLANKAAARLD
jgi:hypothetical protein